MRLFGLKPIYWLLLVVFCVHVFVAAIPANHFVFDEGYYNVAAVKTVHGVADNIEHPPLVKLIVGVATLVVGDDWLAWRLPIILFAVLATALTYLIGRKFLSERLSLFAVSLVSLSTIFLLVGSADILDMPCLAFGLAGVYLVLNQKYGLGGLLFGLSFLSKELAVVMFGATFVYLAIKKVGKWKLLWFSAVGVLVAFFGMWIYDLVWGPTSAVYIGNPVIHLLVVVQYQLNLNGVVRNASSYPWIAPWSWVSPFGVNAFVPTKWIWLEVGGREIYAWLSQPNVVVEYLMFPLLVVLPVLSWVKRNSVALLSWLWICFAFLPWLLAGLFVKTEGNFYVVYSVPFLAVGCAYLYSLIPNRRLKYGLAFSQLAVGLVCFLYYFPLPLIR